MKKYIVIVILLLIAVSGYLFIAKKNSVKFDISKSINICELNGEKVYMFEDGDKGVADGFYSLYLYDKNGNIIDTATSGGHLPRPPVWTKKIGNTIDNCVPNSEYKNK